VLNSLRQINGLLLYPFYGSELVFYYDKVDGTILALADVDSRITILEAFLAVIFIFIDHSLNLIHALCCGLGL